MLHPDDREKALAKLSRFRTEFYECLTARGDVPFELTDALLCTDGPVKRWWIWRWRPSIGVVTAPYTAG